MDTYRLVPEVDKTATRQAVRAWFGVYRQYKLLLSMDFEPHSPPMAPHKGYEDAMDPDLIRAPYAVGDGLGASGERMETPEDRHRKWFCRRTEYVVGKLPEYQGAIIEACYMHQHERPSDLEVWCTLCEQNARWRYSERYYDEQKAIALMTLGEAFRLVQYAEEGTRDGHDTDAK